MDLEATEIILKEMCDEVGADYHSDIEPNFQDWNKKFTWTTKQLNNFKEWIADYLYENKYARVELMRYPIKNKQLCIEAAIDFIEQWGWYVDDDND